MSTRSWALVALFVVNLIYGVNYVVAKGLMPEVIGPSGFILLRVIGATALFWVMRAFMHERVAWSDALRLVLCAVTGVALNQLMFFNGLMRTTPVHASLIMVATPVLVLAMSGIYIGERITWPKLLGVALGAGGALTLVFVRPDSGTGAATLLGDLFILINASSFAIYLVLVKPLMGKYSATTVMSWTFLLGTAMVLPFGAGELAAVQWSALTPGLWGSIAFVVVMVTFVAYLLNTWALRHVNPGVVGTFIYLQPLLATFFTWAQLRTGIQLPGKPPTPDATGGVLQWVCGAAIFLGVHLVTRADRKAA
jgi:drug/metabolite transporter (DMT)-like permease